MRSNEGLGEEAILLQLVEPPLVAYGMVAWGHWLPTHSYHSHVCAYTCTSASMN